MTLRSFSEMFWWACEPWRMDSDSDALPMRSESACSLAVVARAARRPGSGGRGVPMLWHRPGLVRHCGRSLIDAPARRPRLRPARRRLPQPAWHWA